MEKVQELAYLQQTKVGLAELAQDMVDLSKEVVCAKERSPAAEDGVGNLQHAIVDLGLVGCEARREVVDQSVPAFPKVRVCNDADSLTQLCLNGGRHRDHEANHLTLDGRHFVLGQLVVSILIGPAAADKVFEEESGGQASRAGKRFGGNNLEEREGELRLGLFLTNGLLSCARVSALSGVVRG
jgi:hypothetical protein